MSTAKRLHLWLIPPLLAVSLVVGGCSRTGRPVSAAKPPSAAARTAKHPSAGIPPAFWRSSIISQNRYLEIFPRDIGARATSIDHGGMSLIGNYKPFPGTALTTFRPVNGQDLTAVPTTLKPQAWRSVVLTETWTEPPSKRGGAASWVFVVDREGRILGQRIVNTPPQLWK